MPDNYTVNSHVLDLISSLYYLIYTWKKWVYLFSGTMPQCPVCDGHFDQSGESNYIEL